MEENIVKDGQSKLKLQFFSSDELWNDVLRYKIQRGLKNNNQAVEELIKKSLEPKEDGILVYYQDIPEDVLLEIHHFRNKTPLVENTVNSPLFISKDMKSGTFFTECHIKASDLVKLTDQDLAIDPELQEEYRANRELDPDNTSFLVMVEDAEDGRAFSDIVIEYNLSYREIKPLKILGGQHRDEAIKRALKKNIDVVHGIRVYFCLDKDKRAEIMRISNTNINVSPDLRDRIEEHRLEPSGMLRNFCYEANILKDKEDFGDKRKYEGFTPTVKMIRSFIVNFYKGKEYNGDIDKDAQIPYLCSSGTENDKDYIQIFNIHKKNGKFSDTELIEAGKMFAKLHEKQFKNAEKIKSSAKKEFKIKAYNLAIVTSWAFAVGALQKYQERLKKLYSLPDLCKDYDPLSALEMAKSKHKILDPESYRGLGTRSNNSERGRLLQLFLDYSRSGKPTITEQMCNASIAMFHSNQDRKKAEESAKKAYGV